MDFLDPEKKRAHTRRLFLGYFLIGIAVFLAAVILLFQSYGYDLDHKTGKVIQNGLVFVDSHPESSTIYVNGKDSGKTDKRLTVPAGQYTIDLKATGYRTWTKSFMLDGGSIEQLTYPTLFPEKLTSADVQTYDTPAVTTQSLDRKWLLIAQNGSFSAFDQYDMGSPDQLATVVTLPKDVVTTSTAAQKLTAVEWSTDNKHFILKHTYGDATEFIMVDRETPSNSINLNKQFSLTPSSISMKDKRFDQLFIYNAAALTVNLGDSKTKQLTPLLTNVVAYKSHEANTILYAAKDDAQPGKTVIKLWDNGTTYVVHTYAEDPNVMLDVARFDGALYLVVGLQKEGRVYIYKDALAKLKAQPAVPATPFTALKLDAPTKISFSANTRFLAAQSGAKFAVFDFETNRRYNYDAKITATAEQPASWMDGHRILAAHDGKVTVFDFDGTNQQDLMGIVPSGMPYLDRDYTRMFTLNTSPADAKKSVLSRTSLKVGLKN